MPDNRPDNMTDYYPTDWKKTEKANINAETKRIITGLLSRTRAEMEKWVATVYLDDLNLSFNQQGALEKAVDGLRSGLQDNEYSHIGQSDYRDFYDEELEGQLDEMDSMIEDVQQEFTEMIDNGWADEGHNQQVQDHMENEILPRVEGAIDDLVTLIDQLTKGA